MLKTKQANLKRKKRVFVPKDAPLPVPVATVLNEPSHNRSWFYYTGFVEGSAIVVMHSGDMDFLYKMGFFGKGSLSRSQPNFVERKQKVNFCMARKVQHSKDILSPLSNMVIMSKRNYLIHKRYHALSEGRTKEFEDVVMHEEDQHYQPKSSDSEEDAASGDYPFPSSDNLARAQAFQLLKSQRLTADSGPVSGADNFKTAISISNQTKQYLTAMLSQVSLLSHEQIATFLCMPYTMGQLVSKFQEMRIAELNISKRTHPGLKFKKGEVITLDEDDAKDTPTNPAESFVILDSDEEQQNDSDERIKEKAGESHWNEYDGGDVEFWSPATSLPATVNKIGEDNIVCKSVTETQIITDKDNSGGEAQLCEISLPEYQVETEGKDVKNIDEKMEASIKFVNSVVEDTKKYNINLDQRDSVVANTKEADKSLEDNETAMNPNATGVSLEDKEIAMKPKENRQILENKEIAWNPKESQHEKRQSPPCVTPMLCSEESSNDSDDVICIESESAEPKKLQKFLSLPASGDPVVTRSVTFMSNNANEPQYVSAKVGFTHWGPILHFNFTGDSSHLPTAMFVSEGQNTEVQRPVAYVRIYPPVQSLVPKPSSKGVTIRQRLKALPCLSTAYLKVTTQLGQKWDPPSSSGGKQRQQPSGQALFPKQATLLCQPHNSARQQNSGKISLSLNDSEIFLTHSTHFPPSSIPQISLLELQLYLRLYQCSTEPSDPADPNTHKNTPSDPADPNTHKNPLAEPNIHRNRISQVELQDFSETVKKIVSLLKPVSFDKHTGKTNLISKEEFLQDTLDALSSDFQMKLSELVLRMGASTTTELAWLGHLLSKPESHSGVPKQILPESLNKLTLFQLQLLENRYWFLKNHSTDERKQSLLNLTECEQKELSPLNQVADRLGKDDNKVTKSEHNKQIHEDMSVCAMEVEDEIYKNKLKRQNDHSDQESEPKGKKLKPDKSTTESVKSINADSMLIVEELRPNHSVADNKSGSTKGSVLSTLEETTHHDDSEDFGKLSEKDNVVLQINNSEKVNIKRDSLESSECKICNHTKAKHSKSCVCKESDINNSTKNESCEILENSALNESCVILDNSTMNESCLILDNSAMNESCVILENSIENGGNSVVSVPASSVSESCIMDQNIKRISDIVSCKQTTNESVEKPEKDESVPVQNEDMIESLQICISSSSDEDLNKPRRDRSCEENFHPYSVTDDVHPDALIMENTSDGEESADEIMKRKQRWQPCLKKDPYPAKERLHLMLEEAFFLSYGLGCLRILDPEMKVLTLTEMWHRFQILKEEFIPHYVAYHYFRSKGWVPKSGLKFGCDLILYKEGPPFFHGSYSVIVSSVKEKSMLPCTRSDGCNFDQRQTNWIQLAGLNRITEQVAKNLMMCYVIWPANLSKEDTQSPSCISKFQVKEVVLSRWIPSQERENKIDEIP